MVSLLALAQGHEKVTLALITLLPVFLFYGLKFPLLTLFIPCLLLLLAGHLFFFRDPNREVAVNSQLVLSPADGSVYEIDVSNGVIKIRMSLFNVHVTRTPVSGKITSINYQDGKHWPFVSFIRSGTDENARQTIHIENSTGDFLVVQIVGILARRCMSFFSPGDQVQQGERLGIIYYGSEVDVHFPPDKFEILVKRKSKMIAGQTPIAKLRGKLN
ncbi:MAG: phosphatidylserine decarboxylase [Candidatus Heimdallarchaeota archaeon]|nr:MAG: phosphatidylserine decarboxylase [Candidatus Heimdallarchaeota archaeon]